MAQTRGSFWKLLEAVLAQFHPKQRQRKIQFDDRRQTNRVIAEFSSEKKEMMNVVAMALLLSYLGAVVVLVPESPVEIVPVIRSDEIQDEIQVRTGQKFLSFNSS